MTASTSDTPVSRLLRVSCWLVSLAGGRFLQGPWLQDMDPDGRRLHAWLELDSVWVTGPGRRSGCREEGNPGARGVGVPSRRPAVGLGFGSNSCLVLPAR